MNQPFRDVQSRVRDQTVESGPPLEDAVKGSSERSLVADVGGQRDGARLLGDPRGLDGVPRDESDFGPG